MASESEKQPGTQYTWEYAFTVTLRPIMFKTVAEVQFDNSYNDVCDILDKYKIKYTLVAELTKSFNIHYHGVCSFPINLSNNVMKWFHDKFRNLKKLGFVNIKVMEDRGWIEYIFKNLKETKEGINRRPIIKDMFEYADVDLKAEYAMQW